MSLAVAICRCDAAQRMSSVLVYIKKNLQRSPECMSAIAKIVVQLLLHTDESTKVTKPLLQVRYMLYVCCIVVICIATF